MRKISAEKLGDTSNSVQQTRQGILIFNEKIVKMKNQVNDLLVVQKDGRTLFYHIRGYSADDISQALMQLCTENVHRRRKNMSREIVPEHNETQKELVLFLKNKRFIDCKANFGNVAEMNYHIEEFM